MKVQGIERGEALRRPPSVRRIVLGMMAPEALPVRGILLLFILAFLGVGVQLTATLHGVGISPDSTRYVAAARNLAGGRGLQVLGPDAELEPLALWAPLYPVVLSIPTRIGLDAVPAARYLNAFLFAANILLVGLLTSRQPKVPRWAALLASAAFLFSPDIAYVHAWLWTEPMSIFAGFLGLLLVDHGLITGDWRAFIFAAFFLSTSYLLRYAGLAFAVTGVAGVAFFQEQDGRPYRWGRTALFLLLTFLPMALWGYATQSLSGKAIGRSLSIHPEELAAMARVLPVVSDWFLPGRIGPAIRLWAAGVALAFGGVVGVVLIVRRAFFTEKNPRSGRSRMTELLTLFVFCYASMLALARVLFLPPAPISARILTLPYTALLVVGIGLAASGFARLKSRLNARPKFGWTWLPLTLLSSSLFILWLGLNLTHTLKWTSSVSAQGMGYAGVSWSESILIRYLRDLPEDTLIYTNGPDAVYILTGKDSRMLPSWPSDSSPTATDIPISIRRMRDELLLQGGVVAYFRGITWRANLSEPQLKRVLPLEPLLGNEDGSIYAVEAEGRTREGNKESRHGRMYDRLLSHFVKLRRTDEG